jgi:hypothetical protein
MLARTPCAVTRDSSGPAEPLAPLAYWQDRFAAHTVLMVSPPRQRSLRSRNTRPQGVHRIIPGMGRASFRRLRAEETTLVVQSGIGKVLTDGETYRFTGPCTLLLGAIAHCTIVNQSSTPMQVLLL